MLILQTKSPDLCKSYSSTKDTLNFLSDDDFLSFLLDTAQPVISYSESKIQIVLCAWKLENNDI